MQVETNRYPSELVPPGDIGMGRRQRQRRTALLQGFEPIDLGQMASVALLDRVDTKYVMAANQLDELLRKLQPSYRVLEIAGLRSSHYETLYYDTENLAFYSSHHAGRSERYKVRRRSYVDSDLSFLEVKHKTNKGRTVKNRISTERISQRLGVSEQRFVETMMRGGPAQLQPVIRNAFRRITLVSRATPERVTLDTGLRYWFEGTEVPLDGLAIVEVKQPIIDHHSPVVRQLRELGLRRTSISKYCVGMSTMYPHIKHNRFKPILRRIDQITRGQHHDD